MTFYNPICFPSLANMAFLMRFCVPVFLLTCSQEAQVTVLPTSNSRILTSTSTRTLLRSIWDTTTTQYPPTTIVKNTTPGTIGVSGCSLRHPTNHGAKVKKIILTSLETGNPSVQPFPTYMPPPIILTTAFFQPLSLITNSSQSSIALPTKGTSNSSALPLSKSQLSSSKMERRGATDCFQPVATGALPSQLPSRGDHPVPRLGIVSYSYP